MLKIPKKVLDRLNTQIKQYQPIASSQREKDVAEADTVTLVKDVLAYVFGYDKYQELTSEQQIRGTFCDLAVKVDGKVRYLIEVKAAGINLSDAHLRQAINYGAHHGIEWIVLTNAIQWRLYRIKFGQPIDYEEVSSFDLCEVNLRNEEDQRKLFLLCREGLNSDAMDVFHQHALLLNKFTVSQIALSEPVVGVIRREIRKIFPELKVDSDQISDILANEVFKREVVEGDKAKEMQQRIRRSAAKIAKRAEKKADKKAGASSVVETSAEAAAVETKIAE